MKKILMISLLISTIWACKTKEVAPLPKAEFTYMINNEGNVNFRSVSINATKTEWSIDNTKRFDSIFNYNFTRNGNFQVSLTATDDAGNKDVIVKSIAINNLTARLTIYRKFPVGNSPIEVSVDNKFSGIISGQYYYPSTPDCGNVYSASFTKLAEGSHSYFAREISTGATWQNTFNLIGGDCQFIALIK